MKTSKKYKYDLETLASHAVVRDKGQITIPYDIRYALGIFEGDRIEFLLGSDDKVELQKKTSITSQTAGIVKSKKLVLSAKALRLKAEEIIATEAICRANN